MVGGRRALAYKEKTFEVRAAGDGIPLAAIESVKGLSAEIQGRLSFEVAGSGSFEKPDLTIAASLADATFFGHPVPAAIRSEARGARRRRRGGWDRLGAGQVVGRRARRRLLDARVPGRDAWTCADLADLCSSRRSACPPAPAVRSPPRRRSGFRRRRASRPRGRSVVTRAAPGRARPARTCSAATPTSARASPDERVTVGRGPCRGRRHRPASCAGCSTSRASGRSSRPRSRARPTPRS